MATDVPVWGKFAWLYTNSTAIFPVCMLWPQNKSKSTRARDFFIRSLDFKELRCTLLGNHLTSPKASSVSIT